jgi:hypothetical protein
LARLDLATKGNDLNAMIADQVALVGHWQDGFRRAINLDDEQSTLLDGTMVQQGTALTAASEKVVETRPIRPRGTPDAGRNGERFPTHRRPGVGGAGGRRSSGLVNRPRHLESRGAHVRRDAALAGGDNRSNVGVHQAGERVICRWRIGRLALRWDTARLTATGQHGDSKHADQAPGAHPRTISLPCPAHRAPVDRPRAFEPWLEGGVVG